MLREMDGSISAVCQFAGCYISASRWKRVTSGARRRREAEFAMSNQRVRDLYDDIEDFERLLRDAESQARSEWAQDFVGDIYEKYEKYGADMFITDKQVSKLEDIVG